MAAIVMSDARLHSLGDHKGGCWEQEVGFSRLLCNVYKCISIFQMPLFCPLTRQRQECKLTDVSVQEARFGGVKNISSAWK